MFDLGTKLVALLPDDSLSVLEVDRKALVPDGSEVWSKDTCVQNLREILTDYSEADITGVRFPFFDVPTQSKNRPAIALYSPEANHMLTVALTYGAPKQTNLPKHVLEITSEMTSPKCAPSALVDCSKLCTIPVKNEMEATYDDWYDRKICHTIKLYEPDIIREEIVNTILTLSRDNQIIHYQDVTRKFDVGQLVESVVESDGELCIEIVVYQVHSNKRI